MTGRRSSARLAAASSQSSQNSSPPQPRPSPANKKRKNDTIGSSSSAKRGKKTIEPEQKTLEETMQNGAPEQPPAPEKPDEDMRDEEVKPKGPQADQVNGNVSETKQEVKKPEEGVIEAKEEQEQPQQESAEEKKGTEDETKAAPATESKEDVKPAETNGDAIERGAREDNIPSTILEKGIIYFFFRPRVNVDDPQDINDIARSFMIMRPIPLDAKIGDGAIGDDKNCRLLALPKKVLPKSGKDRFITFVEKYNTGFAELKDTFLTGSEYETKTQGTQHTAPVTPLAEGIYAITSTGRESHLAYIINIPAEIGEIQKDFGLKERGSFVVSVKNPSQPAGQQNVPQGPSYPQEIIDEFRGLRWKAVEPKYLDFDGATFLMIGEDYDKATEQRPKDEREGNAPPGEEMERLEGEDEIRIKHLKGDDAIFTDLHVTTKDMPEIRTTW